MFSGCHGIRPRHIGLEHVESDGYVLHVFRVQSAFDQDISGWNTSKVMDMSSMFHNASAFDQDIYQAGTRRK